MTSARHCWVRLPFHTEEYPGLILEWVDEPAEGGTVRRFFVTYVREDEDRAVSQWVTVDQVRRA